MVFLYGLFTFLSVVFLVLLIVGLIKPSLVKMPSRGKAFLVFFVGMILMSALSAFTMPEEEKAKQEAARQEAEQQRETEKLEKEKQNEIDQEPQNLKQTVKVEPDAISSEKSLGFTPDEFRQKLNDGIIELDMHNLKPLKKITVNDGSFQINEVSGLNMTLVGFVNKNGEIKSLTYIFVPTENEQDTLNLMAYAGLTAKIISPNVDSKTKTNALIKVMTKAAEGINNEKNYHSIIIDGIKYSATASPHIGFWVSYAVDTEK